MLDNLVLAIAPVGVRCNLACAYCYHRHLRHTEEKDCVSLNCHTLEYLLSQAKNTATHVAMLWHGGEPLLLGQDRFRKLLECQKQVMGNHPYDHIVQTNGILAKKSWAELFRHYHISVGISLDGPDFVHDAQRTGQFGQGSWAKAVHGYRALVEAGLKPGIAVTLHRNPLPERLADVVYGFLRREKPGRVGIQPAITHKTPTPASLSRFFKRFLGHWHQAGQPFTLKPIEDIRRLGAGLPSLSCHWGPRRCHKFISVGPKGLAYPCMRLHGRPEWLLGDTRHTSLADLMDSPAYGKLLEPPQDCLNCEVFDICRGGCPAERWLLTGGLESRHPLCSFYSRLIRLVLNGS